MHVNPVESGGRWLAPRHVPDQSRVQRPSADAPKPQSAPDEPRRVELQPATRPRVAVQIDRLDNGAQVVTLYDTRTGQPILQLPPEQVIQMVESLLSQLRQDGLRREVNPRGDRQR